MAEIKLALTPFGDGSTVEIDGENIADSVRSLTVKAAGGRPTEVTFELAARPTVIEGQARVYLSAYTAKVLARFGWYPPIGSTVNEDGSVLLDEPIGDASAVSE